MVVQAGAAGVGGATAKSAGRHERSRHSNGGQPLRGGEATGANVFVAPPAGVAPVGPSSSPSPSTATARSLAPPPYCQDSDRSLNDISLEYSFEELQAATDNFCSSNRVGQGAYGNVFRGVLKDGNEVAVKYLHAGQQQAAGFEEEVKVLSKFRHQNLVILMGFARHMSQRLLVYELLPGGDVGTRLQRGPLLDWRQRLNVALDAACGLSHLHNQRPKVYHRDIKSANILLDRNGSAKWGDFGLACLSSNKSHRVSKTAGTVGYADPNYIATSVVTEQSEVYSFGWVLVELLTNKPPAVQHRDGKISYFLNQLKDPITGLACLQRLLPYVPETAQFPEPVKVGMALIALRCIQPEGIHRPDFRSIVLELRSFSHDRNARGSVTPALAAPPAAAAFTLVTNSTRPGVAPLHPNSWINGLAISCRGVQASAGTAASSSYGGGPVPGAPPLPGHQHVLPSSRMFSSVSGPVVRDPWIAVPAPTPCPLSGGPVERAVQLDAHSLVSPVNDAAAPVGGGNRTTRQRSGAAVRAKRSTSDAPRNANSPPRPNAPPSPAAAERRAEHLVPSVGTETPVITAQQAVPAEPRGQQASPQSRQAVTRGSEPNSPKLAMTARNEQRPVAENMNARGMYIPTLSAAPLFSVEGRELKGVLQGILNDDSSSGSLGKGDRMFPGLTRPCIIPPQASNGHARLGPETGYLEGTLFHSNSDGNRFGAAAVAAPFAVAHPDGAVCSVSGVAAGLEPRRLGQRGAIDPVFSARRQVTGSASAPSGAAQISGATVVNGTAATVNGGSGQTEREEAELPLVREGKFGFSMSSNNNDYGVAGWSSADAEVSDAESEFGGPAASSFNSMRQQKGLEINRDTNSRDRDNRVGECSTNNRPGCGDMSETSQNGLTPEQIYPQTVTLTSTDSPWEKLPVCQTTGSSDRAPGYRISRGRATVEAPPVQGKPELWNNKNLAGEAPLLRGTSELMRPPPTSLYATIVGPRCASARQDSDRDNSEPDRLQLSQELTNTARAKLNHLYTSKASQRSLPHEDCPKSAQGSLTSRQPPAPSTAASTTVRRRPMEASAIPACKIPPLPMLKMSSFERQNTRLSLMHPGVAAFADCANDLRANDLRANDPRANDLRANDFRANDPRANEPAAGAEWTAAPKLPKAKGGRNCTVGPQTLFGGTLSTLPGSPRPTARMSEGGLRRGVKRHEGATSAPTESQVPAQCNNQSNHTQQDHSEGSRGGSSNASALVAAQVALRHGAADVRPSSIPVLVSKPELLNVEHVNPAESADDTMARRRRLQDQYRESIQEALLRRATFAHPSPRSVTNGPPSLEPAATCRVTDPVVVERAASSRLNRHESGTPSCRILVQPSSRRSLTPPRRAPLSDSGSSVVTAVFGNPDATESLSSRDDLLLDGDIRVPTVRRIAPPPAYGPVPKQHYSNGYGRRSDGSASDSSVEKGYDRAKAKSARCNAKSRTGASLDGHTHYMQDSGHPLRYTRTGSCWLASAEQDRQTSLRQSELQRRSRIGKTTQTALPSSRRDAGLGSASGKKVLVRLCEAVKGALHSHVPRTADTRSENEQAPLGYEENAIGSPRGRTTKYNEVHTMSRSTRGAATRSRPLGEGACTVAVRERKVGHARARLDHSKHQSRSSSNTCKAQPLGTQLALPMGHSATPTLSTVKNRALRSSLRREQHWRYRSRESDSSSRPCDDKVGESDSTTNSDGFVTSSSCDSDVSSENDRCLPPPPAVTPKRNKGPAPCCRPPCGQPDDSVPVLAQKAGADQQCNREKRFHRQPATTSRCARTGTVREPVRLLPQTGTSTGSTEILRVTGMNQQLTSDPRLPKCQDDNRCQSRPPAKLTGESTTDTSLVSGPTCGGSVSKLQGDQLSLLLPPVALWTQRNDRAKLQTMESPSSGPSQTTQAPDTLSSLASSLGCTGRSWPANKNPMAIQEQLDPVSASTVAKDLSDYLPRNVLLRPGSGRYLVR